MSGNESSSGTDLTQDKNQNPETDLARDLDQFKLVGPDERVPSERRWWRREAIYLSDVSLAVHLSLEVVEFKKDEQNAARQALYTYLRRVNQIALERDYLRPLACVIGPALQPSPETLSALKSWAPNQDWHRGAFTLYIEIPDRDIPDRDVTDPSPSDCDCDSGPAWNYQWRLLDLLSPKPEQLESQQIAPVDRRKMSQELIEKLDTSSKDLEDKAIGHARKLVESFDQQFEHIAQCLDKSSDKNEDQGKQDCFFESGSPLFDWTRSVILEARELSRGNIR